MSLEKTVTKAKAAELLGISLPTLNAWLKSEKVKLNVVKGAGIKDRILIREINELKKYL